MNRVESVNKRQGKKVLQKAEHKRKNDASE